MGSRKAGLGDKVGGFASDSDRGFGVVKASVKRVIDRGVLSPSSCSVFFSSCSVKLDLLYVGRCWLASGAVDIVVDMLAASLWFNHIVLHTLDLLRVMSTATSSSFLFATSMKCFFTASLRPLTQCVSTRCFVTSHFVQLEHSGVPQTPPEMCSNASACRARNSFHDRTHQHRQRITPRNE